MEEQKDLTINEAQETAQDIDTTIENSNLDLSVEGVLDNETAAEVNLEEQSGSGDEKESETQVSEEEALSAEIMNVLLDNGASTQPEEDPELLKEKLNAKWYVLHTFSGYENVAKENLEIVVDKFNLQKRIFDIIIPMEDVVEEKNGKRKVVQRKVMPGYILVKMNYGDDIWHAVTRTRGITGFVGPKGRPLPLTAEEIRKMRLEVSTVVDESLAVDDKVEILEGPLNEFIGTVVSVDFSAGKCRVVVEMFGRETPVDLALTQVRKIS